MISPTMILAAIVGGCVLFGAGVLTGMKLESDRSKAKMLDLERNMHEQFKQKMDAERAISQELSKELNDAVVTREQEAATFREELRKSKTSGKPLAVCPPAPAPRRAAKPPAMPLPSEPPASQPVEPPPAPAVRLTAEFARLYDLALAPAGLPAPADTGGADAPAASAGSVDAETVLAVHAANAESWGECREHLAGWQKLARRYGWVK